GGRGAGRPVAGSVRPGGRGLCAPAAGLPRPCGPGDDRPCAPGALSAGRNDAGPAGTDPAPRGGPSEPGRSVGQGAGALVLPAALVQPPVRAAGGALEPGL